MATLTIQPSTADNYIFFGASNTNYGSLTYLVVGQGGDPDEKRALLKFDFSALVPGCTISEAKLYLYYYTFANSDPVGRTYWAYRLTQRNWTGTGSSWNHYVGTTDWATDGGDYTITDGASALVPASFGWMNWNVTTQVQFAQASTSKVAHFIIRDATENTDKGAYFYSNNYTTDTAKCPYLILTYTVSGWAHNTDKVTALGTAKINAITRSTGIAKVNGL